jgi:hypothetical protein
MPTPYLRHRLVDVLPSYAHKLAGATKVARSRNRNFSGSVS